MILTLAANAFLEKPFTAQWLTRLINGPFWRCRFRGSPRGVLPGGPSYADHTPLCGISFLALSYDLRRSVGEISAALLGAVDFDGDPSVVSLRRASSERRIM
jgi:hypothetical protein